VSDIRSIKYKHENLPVFVFIVS